MRFSGISDESGRSIHTQIKAHKELGWEHLELRNVDGELLSMMADDKCSEGEGFVRKIVADLLSRGYDGGISIEPHVAAVIHQGEGPVPEEILYSSYLEYGRRFMKIVSEVVIANNPA